MVQKYLFGTKGPPDKQYENKQDEDMEKSMNAEKSQQLEVIGENNNSSDSMVAGKEHISEIPDKNMMVKMYQVRKLDQKTI